MLFTAIATAAISIAAPFLAGTIAVPLLAGALAIGASYAVQAIAGKRQQTEDTTKKNSFAVQGKLLAGGDLPRSFNLGWSATAGSLVWFNDWGNDGETPNAYHTRVIRIADLPTPQLRAVWVAGVKVTLGATAHPDFGYPVTEYNRDGKDHLWIKYYDGTQTAADPMLVGRASSAARPWQSSRVGYGISYVIATALTHDTLWTGLPEFLFEVGGIPLYDISKDSTAGGDGPQRWSDPSTWGGDGDDLPAVQAYNVLRGISYNGQWLYGLQRMSAVRLPATNWIAQIQKCRAAIQGASGVEQTYRSGGQVTVDVVPATTLDALMTACQGRISEIGGYYKCRLGAPDSPTFAWTDDDILSTEEQNFAPFFGLADSVNGIAATYPSTAERWGSKPAPAYLRPDLEIEDGRRRLLANPRMDFVPYPAQVQRLQKSAIEEARRARRHTIVWTPEYFIVEPGDVGTWTSARNGYDAKLFRVDGMVDQPNLSMVGNVTEVDPADFVWDHDADYTPVSNGVVVINRPSAQGVVDWFAEAITLVDETGLDRRPAIRLSWDGSLPGIRAVSFQIRLKTSQTVVHSGRTDYYEAGSVIISNNLLPATTYEAQGLLVPTAPRDMTPSDWLTVTTPDTRFGLIDLQEVVTKQVTRVLDDVLAQQEVIEQLVASIASNDMARNWLDKRQARSELAAQAGGTKAAIEEVRTVAVDTQEALAAYQVTVSATFDAVTSSVSQEALARSQADSALAGQIDTVSTTVGANTASISTIQTSVNGIKVQYGVLGTINGSTGGFTLEGIGKLDGTASWTLNIRGDVIADGSITAPKMSVGTLSAISANVGTVTAGVIRSGNSKMIIDLDNSRIEIYD